MGSIPAHAGEPDTGPGLPTPNGVYPRARRPGPATSIPAHAGDLTEFARVYPRARGGAPSWRLSPRTRGSPRASRQCARRVVADNTSYSGSIPAHAGEPSRERVYESTGERTWTEILSTRFAITCGCPSRCAMINAWCSSIPNAFRLSADPGAEHPSAGRGSGNRPPSRSARSRVAIVAWGSVPGPVPGLSRPER